jgi:nitrogen fixation protein NifU and related proteins
LNDGMYRENILEHYRKPHNFGSMANASCSGHAINPFCGDDITISLKVRGKKGAEKIADVKFDGHACAICTASASMLTEEVKGKPLELARKYCKEDLLSLLGVSPGPTRLKCALLPLKALKLAVYSYIGKKISDEELDSEVSI